MKSLLYAIDAPKIDEIEKRISKEPIVNKYWLHISCSILLMIATIIVIIISVNMGIIRPAKTFEVDIASGKPVPKLIRTLQYPQESSKHRTAWVNEAVMKIYSFDFLNIDKKLKYAKYYFTEDSYVNFIEVMKASKIIDRVKDDKLEVFLVPLIDPIFVSLQNKGENKIWHYRVPVLISYYGGVNIESEKKTVEIKIIRSPVHKNPKGLEILSFRITGSNS